MSKLKNEIEEDDVRLAVRGLLRQANMYSMSHLTNPAIQHNFREEYRFLGKCLVSDYRKGVLSRDKVLSYVRQERQSLIDQAAELGKYGIGLVAGIGQLSTGYALCVTSSIFSVVGASWCSSTGTTMMAHGGNNIYENSYNMTGNIVQNWKGKYTGNYGDGNGYLRKLYRSGAEHLGMQRRDGDLAYASVDLATSLYGLTNTLKSVPNANVPNAKQFKLFYYTSQDFSKGWRTMSGSSLANEVAANSVTAVGAATPYFDGSDK
ncbi:hypothetical protein GCM10007938_26710 [Vibrio zhanjiangensis]|uniref:DUF4225 domain-containing protein n=1 Tax=Vibrio zhanjiangensis TaxID=1046128 RepID=A0ABQ6F1M1_9VIBR|nr:DUF4225 domain-containing protein [Vibrio zhanjiangensis]GLT18889.1 hypothetical protein GCM10007938_26710 [Vibrio zhanjiangensis]